MKIYRGLESALYAARTAATMGTFDGLHLGHQKIIRNLLEEARRNAASRSLVITFDPHPQTVLRRKDTSVDILTTIDERLEIFEALGIDEVLVIAFTKEFAATSYDEFFESVLVNRLGVSSLVVGFDHAFGKNRQGDVEHVRRLAPQFGVDVTVVPQLVIEEKAINSTMIRKALQRGEVHEAAEMLGRPYKLQGEVINGDKIGRTLNFPTANLKIPKDKLIPMPGVYAAMVETPMGSHKSAVSIGSRPTVDDSGRIVVEAHLLDFAGDLYGAELSVYFEAFLRGQEKYKSLKELTSAITRDVKNVSAYFSTSYPGSR